MVTVESNAEPATPEVLFAPPDTAQQLARFSPTDAAIAAMAAEYMPLAIAGPSDTKGFKVVHEARMMVKQHRIQVEKVRKELKADALEYGRKVDAEAKRIVGMLEPIESHLAKQEADYEAAKEAIRNAERLRLEAEAKAKADAEAARIRAEQEAEAARIKAEQEKAAEAIRIEREKLEAERRAIEAERARIAAEQEAERARQRAEAERIKLEQDRIAAERAKVEAEQRRIEEEKAAKVRAAEMEKARAEAAERARVETEQRLAREAAEREAAAKAQAEAEEAARKRAEALRPDREKLLAIAKAVSAIEMPTVSAEATDAAKQVQQVLVNASIKIQSIVAAMSPAGNW